MKKPEKKVKHLQKMILGEEMQSSKQNTSSQKLHLLSSCTYTSMTLTLLLLVELLLLGVSNVASREYMEQNRMVLESCLGQFDVHKNTIIRTGESQALGGKYLEGVELDNIEECQRLCCETEACDVYIFEAKNDGFCYLFECGPPENFHCKFTRHANYTSAVLTKHRELNYGAILLPTTTTSTTTTTTTTTTTSTTPKPNIHNVSQQEFELTSLKVKQQAAVVANTDNTVEALNNVAISKTQKDKSKQKSATSNICGRFQFACHSGECIAVYNACDGIPQCVDGSDEGPECSGAPSSSQPLAVAKTYVVNNRVDNTPRPLPQPIDNREDHNAWANRQIVTELHQQAINKPKSSTLLTVSLLELNFTMILLQLQLINGGATTLSQVQPLHTIPQSVRVGYSPVNGQGYSGQFIAGQEHISLPSNQNWPEQHITSKQLNHVNPGFSPPQVVPQVQTVTYNVERQTQHENKVKSNGGVVEHISNSNQADARPKNPLSENQASYEDYLDKSTEPPKKKQHKHKKLKTQSELKLVDDDDEHENPQTQMNVPSAHQPIPALHEQYKVIHDSLGLEFRDHDGYSERPGGAMLSLTLGLLVTAALAILVTCRLRTVRRRSRRPGGKTSYAQESDFLVNGMYL